MTFIIGAVWPRPLYRMAHVGRIDSRLRFTVPNSTADRRILRYRLNGIHLMEEVNL
jgi:hypothetical protein